MMSRLGWKLGEFLDSTVWMGGVETRLWSSRQKEEEREKKFGFLVPRHVYHHERMSGVGCTSA